MLRISRRVKPHRVEELLDRIWCIASEHGTFEINNIIDEYREDIYIERTEGKESPHGSRTQDRHRKGR